MFIVNERLKIEGELSEKLYKDILEYLSRPIGKELLPNPYKIPIKFVFLAMENAFSKEKIRHVFRIILDIYNNNQIIPIKDFDKIAIRCLELGFPEEMNQIFINHQAFHYYPNTNILPMYLDYYISKKEYDFFVNFYKSIGNSYYLHKSNEFLNKCMKFSIDNKDFNLSAKIYIDIIDYSNMKFPYLINIIYGYSKFDKDICLVHLLENELKNKKFLSVHDEIYMRYALILFYLNMINSNSELISSSLVSLSLDKENQIKNLMSHIENINKIHIDDHDLIDNNNKDNTLIISYTLRSLSRKFSGTDEIKRINPMMSSIISKLIGYNILTEQDKSIKEVEDVEYKHKEPVREDKSIKEKELKKEVKKESTLIDVKRNPNTKSPLLYVEDPNLKKKSNKKKVVEEEDETDKKPKKKK